MVKPCGYRLLRFLVVCAVIAIISLVILQTRRSTRRDLNAWTAADDDVPQTDEFDEKGLYPLPSGDNGHLELPVNEILMPDLVVPDVHFIWCGERWFEFKNYLSVMSVRRAMQPDKIYIHYEQTPPLDRVYYHQV